MSARSPSAHSVSTVQSAAPRPSNSKRLQWRSGGKNLPAFGAHWIDLNRPHALHAEETSTGTNSSEQNQDPGPAGPEGGANGYTIGGSSPG